MPKKEEEPSLISKNMPKKEEEPSLISKNMPKKEEVPSSVSKNMPKKELPVLVYTDMQKEEVDEVVKFLYQDFMQREPLARGLHLTSEDIEDWFYDAVKHWQGTGVSVVARDQDEDCTLVGVLLSFVVNKDGDHALMVDKSKNEKSRLYGSIVTQLESKVDVFELLAIDTTVEMAFLSVREECGGRGIGTRLCQESERRGLALGCQAATVQATNIFTQRIFDKLGYQTVAEMNLADLKHEGVPCLDLTAIGDNTTAKMMAKKFT